MISSWQRDKEDEYGLPLASNPSQPIRLASSQSIAGVQIRQLQVITTQPLPRQTPINIQKTVVTGGRRVTIQFLRDPSDLTFVGASAVIQTPEGTSALQASSTGNAVSFVTPATTAPGSVIVQTNTVNGSTSNDFGEASSNRLDRT